MNEQGEVMNEEDEEDDEVMNEEDEVEDPLHKFPLYQSANTRLSTVIQDEDFQQIIEGAVCVTNNIMIYGLQFLKLYLIQLYDNDAAFPTLNQSFVVKVLYTVCVERTDAYIPPNLLNFFELHFRELMGGNIPSRSKLGNILNYSATEIITMYENNIIQHYFDYVTKYISVVFNERVTLDEIKESDVFTDEEKTFLTRIFKAHLSNLKTDLLRPTRETPLTSDVCLTYLLPYLLPRLLPHLFTVFLSFLTFSR